MTLSLGHADWISLKRGWVLFHFTSTNVLGEECFAYILTLEEQMKHLEQMLAHQEFIDISQYGHVVHSGIGTPTEADAQKAEAACNEIFQNDAA